MKVFVSYAYDDLLDLDSVLEEIQERVPELKGAEVVDPSRTLSAGDDFRAEIARQIRSSDLYLLLWTEKSSKSPYILYEAGMADASDKRILVVATPQAPEIVPALKDSQVLMLEAES